MLEQTRGMLLRAKFRLDRFILLPFGDWRRKTPNFAVSWTSAFCSVANWRQSEKAKHGCITADLPLSSLSKSFLFSNVFMAISGAQSLTFRSLTDRQRQTKNERIWPLLRRVKSSSTKLNMVIEDLEHVLAPPKLLGVRHSS